MSLAPEELWTLIRDALPSGNQVYTSEVFWKGPEDDGS